MLFRSAIQNVNGSIIKRLQINSEDDNVRLYKSYDSGHSWTYLYTLANASDYYTKLDSQKYLCSNAVPQYTISFGSYDNRNYTFAVRSSYIMVYADGNWVGNIPIKMP